MPSRPRILTPFLFSIVDRGCRGGDDVSGDAAAVWRSRARIPAKIGDVRHETGGACIQDKVAGRGVRAGPNEDQVACPGKGNGKGSRITGDDGVCQHPGR